MKKFTHISIALCLVIFFSYAIYSLTLEGMECYSIFKRFNGLSDNQKRHRLIGELYEFATKCSNIIPENSSILYLSNFSINQPISDLLLNYYLYPRKLYWINNVIPYLEPPPEIKDLDQVFLCKRNIEWIIFRYPKEYELNKVVQLKNGKAIKSFILD
ncbi:MAG: hypothetical protein KAR43_10245 [Deltaproteobacteria bacterium]|nr:hypothetical protein [Deltaproteobacteria bacterium]